MGVQCVSLFAAPWTVAHQALPSVAFSGQEYWSGVLFPTPGDLPYPGIEPVSLMSPALAGRFFTTCPTWKAPNIVAIAIKFWGIANLTE